MEDYSTKYTLSSVHNDGGKEDIVTHSFDATDQSLSEVLEKIEIFLIAAGFDWIKKGEIQHVDSISDEDYHSTAEAELFDEYSVSAEEMYNRLNGLDNTAKIVEFPKKEPSEDTITLTGNGLDGLLFTGDYDIGSVTFDNMDVKLDTSDINFTDSYNISLNPSDITFNFDKDKEKD